MIKAHQPTIFGSRVAAAISSVQDGHMKLASDADAQTKEHIKAFVEKADALYENLNYIRVTYDGDDFLRYKTVSKPEHALKRTVADALATNEKGVGLFLPLADCTGAILFDPVKNALMVSHLGRHSTEQYGGRESVEYMKRHFGSHPQDILVWLSPSPNGEVYPLWAFDNRSFRDVILEQLTAAGIEQAHIEASTVDTITDMNYFSHSEFLKGHRDENGRYGIVAQLT